MKWWRVFRQLREKDRGEKWALESGDVGDAGVVLGPRGGRRVGGGLRLRIIVATA